MRILPKLKNLTVLVWNVGGLTEEKIYDQKFKNNFRYDIICLTETHTTKGSKIDVPGYIHSQSTREIVSKSYKKKNQDA